MGGHIDHEEIEGATAVGREEWGRKQVELTFQMRTGQLRSMLDPINSAKMTCQDTDNSDNKDTENNSIWNKTKTNQTHREP